MSAPVFFSRKYRRARDRGFSLIITLMMMMLLSILALGLLSLSTITLRASGNGAATSVARANARLALMMAIGDLQKQMGPDTRVSVPASLSPTAVPQPRWLAAYNTLNPATGLPPVGHKGSGAVQQWSTDARASDTAWRESYRLGWLVSQPPGAGLTPGNPGSDLVTLAEIPGAKTTEKVDVPRVDVYDAQSHKAGSYAFWVSDESTKARLDQVDSRAKGKTTFAIDDQAYSLMVAQRADASKTEGFDWHEKITATTAGKLATLDTVELASSDPKALARHRDSFTVYSEGVLADTAQGGLKLDLGAYMDSIGDGDPAIDLQSLGRGVIGDTVSFVPGQRYALTGANYGSLRGWRRVGQDASGATTDPQAVAIEPRFPANRATSRSGNQVREGTGVDSDNEARLKVIRPGGGTDVGVPVHPVLADARFSMDFVYENTGGTAKILPLIYPRVKLWNPYNATLKAADYVVVMPFRTQGAVFDIAGNSATSQVNLNAILSTAGLADTSFRYFVFTVPAATFGPGECKVFMPDLRNSAGSGLPRGGSAPCAARYDAGNIGTNRLTASADNDPNGAFYIDSTTTFSTTVLGGAAKPTIKCSTGSQLFYAEAWYLKGATGSTSVPTTTVLDSTNSKFPTLQSIYLGIRGTDSYSGGTVDEWEMTWDNPGQRQFLSQAELTPNPTGPLQWARHIRFLRLDEVGAQFNNLDRLADGYRITAAVGGDWNPRAGIHVRFPSVPSGSWYWRFRHPFVSPVERELPATLAAGTAVSGDSFVASPFWSESASGHRANRFCLYDVQPASMPLVSVARLRHVGLSPFGWQASSPIAGSRPPFYVDAASTVSAEIAGRSASDQWQKMKADGASTTNVQDIVGSPAVIAADQMLLYDVAFEANAALFDRYFFSSMPRNASGRTTWNGTTILPNSRMKRYEGVYAGIPSKTLLSSSDEASKPAAMLLQSGVFNVNSTDVEAWKAVLSGLRDTTRATASGDAKSRHPYSRNHSPFEAEGPDSPGTADSGPFAPANFDGLPDLDDSEIAALASAVVDEVKTRGPFLSMSDFVNRRLNPDKSSAPDPAALNGTLDAAIANTSINGTVQNSGVAQTGLTLANTDGFGSSTMPVDYRHMSPSRNSGMPGSLTQGDLLEPLAPLLTARGDTFVVRAYGDARDANGTILAKAWCEAVVQRLPHYLEHLAPGAPKGSGNEPAEPVVREAWGTASGRSYPTGDVTVNTNLTPVNTKFGRRFQISGFRWLSSSDIHS